MTIEWNDRLMSTGVEEIDDQHKTLLKHLNDLFEALHAGVGQDALESTLEFLGGYAAWHFSVEEDCFERHQCPAASANKQAHAAFMGVFGELGKRLMSEGATPALAVEVQQKVTDWVRNHIVRVDTKLRPCVKAASA